MRQIPADPRLEGLEELFPAEGAPDFVARAAEEMFGEPIDPREGTVLHSRYWPAHRCVALWSFPGRDGRPRLVSGKLFPDAHGAKTVERSSFRRLLRRAQDSNGTIGAPYRLLAERRLLLLAFPLDGRLRGLPDADSEPWIRRVLCPAIGLAPESVERIERRTLSFKPWRRCVFHYRMHGPEGSRGFFAKVFRDDRGQALYERASAVHRELRRVRATWDTPPALAYLPAEKILVFDQLEGAVEISDLLHDARGDARARELLLESFERAGEAVGGLRELRIDGLPRKPPAKVLKDVRKRTAGIERVAPDLADTLARALERLEIEARDLETELLLPSHYAFRHDQLLLRDGRLGVLDLDGLCLSGRSADAGYFLGFLDMAGVRRPRQRELLGTCEEAFLAGLETGGGASPEWLAWYRAAARVKKVTRSFLSLDRKWPESAAALDAGFVEATPNPGGSPR